MPRAVEYDECMSDDSDDEARRQLKKSDEPGKTQKKLEKNSKNRPMASSMACTDSKETFF